MHVRSAPTWGPIPSGNLLPFTRHDVLLQSPQEPNPGRSFILFLTKGIQVPLDMTIKN